MGAIQQFSGTSVHSFALTLTLKCNYVLQPGRRVNTMIITAAFQCIAETNRRRDAQYFVRHVKCSVLWLPQVTINKIMNILVIRFL